jgi:hypothetical protein
VPPRIQLFVIGIIAVASPPPVAEPHRNRPHHIGAAAMDVFPNVTGPIGSIAARQR